MPVPAPDARTHIPLSSKLESRPLKPCQEAYSSKLKAGVKTTETITFLLLREGVVKRVRSGTHEQSSRWRHRPSHPYPLPWAVGEQQRGNPRKKEAATATKLPALASFEYFDRRV